MYNYVFGKNGSLSSGAPPKSGDFHQTWISELTWTLMILSILRLHRESKSWWTYSLPL